MFLYIFYFKSTMKLSIVLQRQNEIQILLRDLLLFMIFDFESAQKMI